MQLYDQYGYHSPQHHSGRVPAMSAKGPRFNPGSGIVIFVYYQMLQL